MSSNALESLLPRVDQVLRSAPCHAIRFAFDSVRIQRFMYDYIAGAIRDGQVHLGIGSGNHYDPKWNDLTFFTDGVPAPTIVHEATHAVIDATHVDKVISTGTHEGAAYLAETLYVLNAGFSGHSLDARGLGAALYPVARQIQEFNATHPSGLFTVPPTVTESIKDILEHSALHMNVNHTERMDGIADGPRRGLLGRMVLDQRSR